MRFWLLCHTLLTKTEMTGTIYHVNDDACYNKLGLKVGLAKKAAISPILSQLLLLPLPATDLERDGPLDSCAPHFANQWEK